LPVDVTADVVLAEADGQIWLVLGDDHIETVLLGELSDGVTIEIVSLRNRAAVMALWWQINPLAAADGQPWIINPMLSQRLRGLVEPDRRSISFTPWSAMLSDEAQGVIAGVATQAGGLVLRQFGLESPAPGLADLQRLRLQLVRAALERAGADPAGITERIDPAESDTDAEKLDILANEAPLQ
jgi:hypothetical protein